MATNGEKVAVLRIDYDADVPASVGEDVGLEIAMHRRLRRWTVMSEHDVKRALGGTRRALRNCADCACFAPLYTGYESSAETDRRYGRYVALATELAAREDPDKRRQAGRLIATVRRKDDEAVRHERVAAAALGAAAVMAGIALYALATRPAAPRVGTESLARPWFGPSSEGLQMGWVWSW